MILFSAGLICVWNSKLHLYSTFLVYHPLKVLNKACHIHSIVNQCYRLIISNYKASIIYNNSYNHMYVFWYFRLSKRAPVFISLFSFILKLFVRCLLTDDMPHV